MAVTIDHKKNVSIKKGDSVGLLITTVGMIQAVVGNTAIFMLKVSDRDADEDAVITKRVVVAIPNEIRIGISSSETALLLIKRYYWSVKHTKGDSDYTIIPDNGNSRYPYFKVGGVLINE